MEKEKLKEILEDAVKDNPDVVVKGEFTYLKTPEQREAEKQLNEWKSETHKVAPIKEFRIPHELINVLLSTDQYNGLVFYGEGGIGKTVLTLSSIKNTLKPKEWEYSNGYTTPLALYEFLYKNRNAKVLLMDDVEGLFTHPLSLSLLKGALWDSDGKRIVQYSSKSSKTSIPSAFVMTAKIIILCNNIPKENDASTRALLSRTIHYEVLFSFKQKMRICNLFLDKDPTINEEQKKQVRALLKSNVNEATQEFNFRTLRKLIAFVVYNPLKAEELFKATTITDELKAAYLRVSSSGDMVKAQIEVFMEITGRGRRTYFRIKKELSK